MTNATLFPAFTQTLNLGPEVASNLFRQGVLTTNNPNGTSFDFTDINRHGPIEDDSSLSRKDVYFGDAVAFDNYTWAQTKSYFTEEIIDIQHASDARVSRLFWSNWTNPEYNWTKSAAPAATFGAVTLFMSVLGDNEAGTVRKDFVNELFGK